MAAPVRGQRPLRGSELVEYPPQSNKLDYQVVDEDRQFGSHQRPVQRGGRLSRNGVRSVPIVVLIYPADVQVLVISSLVAIVQSKDRVC